MDCNLGDGPPGHGSLLSRSPALFRAGPGAGLFRPGNRAGQCRIDQFEVRGSDADGYLAGTRRRIHRRQ